MSFFPTAIGEVFAAFDGDVKVHLPPVRREDLESEEESDEALPQIPIGPDHFSITSKGFKFHTGYELHPNRSMRDEDPCLFQGRQSRPVQWDSMVSRIRIKV